MAAMISEISIAPLAPVEQHYDWCNLDHVTGDPCHGDGVWLSNDPDADSFAYVHADRGTPRVRLVWSGGREIDLSPREVFELLGRAQQIGLERMALSAF